MNSRALFVLLWVCTFVGCGSDANSNAATSDASMMRTDAALPDTSTSTNDTESSLPKDAGVQGSTWGYEPPIVLTIDLHMDPLPHAAPVEGRRKAFKERLGNAQWLLDTLKGTGAKITFLAGPEFYEFCMEDQEKAACFETLTRLYESGGSLGTHTHNDIGKGPHEWSQLPGSATPEQCHESWDDAVTLTNAAITALMGLTDKADIMAVNNIHGSHLPKDNTQYDELMVEFGFDVLESGPEEDFYGLYGHHIWNVYRPSPANWMTEDPKTQYVLVPSGPVIGKLGVHKGVEQDMRVPHVQTMFLQLLANWQHRVRTNAPDQIWTYGFAIHGYDISEGSEIRAALVEFVEWVNDHFVGKTLAGQHTIATWDGRAPLAKAFEAWEQDNPGAVAFSYNSTEKEDSKYPYLLSVATELQNAQFKAPLDVGKDISAYHFDRDGASVVMLWSQSDDAQMVDLTGVFTSGDGVKVINGITGQADDLTTATVEVAEDVLIVVSANASTQTKPNPEPKPGNGNDKKKCGDGMCDDFEQKNPKACPKDCD